MKTALRYRIGDKAYIVEHCPEPSLEHVNDGFDPVDWQSEHTKRVEFPSLVRAVDFARKVVKKTMFGVVDIYEAEFINPYRGEFPDSMVKYSALRWNKIEGGYECEINR